MVNGEAEIDTGWEVLYSHCQPPSLDSIYAALAEPGAAGRAGGQIVCEQIVDPGSGHPMLTCAIAGLSFEIASLSYRKHEEHAVIEHLFGLENPPRAVRTGLSIMPGSDIATVADAFPMVMAGAMLVQHVLRIKDAAAVVWCPIGSAMEARYFVQIIDDWLEGGTFPSLGLTAFRQAPDGGLHSHGLALFTGQELRLPPAIARHGAKALSLGARLIDRLVENEPVRAPLEIEDDNGRVLALVPSSNARFVIVNRR